MLRFTLIDEARRQRAIEAVRAAAIGSVVMVRDGDARSPDQNAALWAKLTDIAQQVEWYGRKLSPETWKTMFTASLSRQDVVPGIDGGFVAVGEPTSSMSRKRFSELLELIAAFGAERGVRWNDEARA